MANVNQTNINSKDVSLSDVKKMLEGLDPFNLDLKNKTDEELGEILSVVALVEQKLAPLFDAINSVSGRSNMIKALVNEEIQVRDTLFTVLDDANGDEYQSNAETITKTVVDRAELDKETGLSISVSCNNPGVYTKASVRAKKSSVLAAVENGTLSSNVVRTTTYQQGTFIKVASKKGGE